MKKESNIKWENTEIKKAFYKLENIDKELFKQINNALNNIEVNAFCCRNIPKRLIPKN